MRKHLNKYIINMEYVELRNDNQQPCSSLNLQQKCKRFSNTSLIYWITLLLKQVVFPELGAYTSDTCYQPPLRLQWRSGFGSAHDPSTRGGKVIDFTHETMMERCTKTYQSKKPGSCLWETPSTRRTRNIWCCFYLTVYFNIVIIVF